MYQVKKKNEYVRPNMKVVNFMIEAGFEMSVGDTEEEGTEEYQEAEGWSTGTRGEYINQ